MSYEDYRVGQYIELNFSDDDFYGLIQGCMRMADSDNLEKFKTAFPEVWEELRLRYISPGGLLPGEANDVTN